MLKLNYSTIRPIASSSEFEQTFSDQLTLPAQYDPLDTLTSALSLVILWSWIGWVSGYGKADGSLGFEFDLQKFDREGVSFDVMSALPIPALKFTGITTIPARCTPRGFDFDVSEIILVFAQESPLILKRVGLTQTSLVLDGNAHIKFEPHSIFTLPTEFLDKN